MRIGETAQGMIRKMKCEDLDPVMDIWLASNLDAHDFISHDYWKRNYSIVREAIQKADIFVYEDKDGKIAGFTGVTDGYLAGIFVRRDRRSRGIGKALLDYCKRRNPKLFLHVYKKNLAAYRFYKREGFLEEGIHREPVTGEEEYCQVWEEKSV